MEADTFGPHRRVLTAVAYQILGSATDAEDIVQDAWLRWSGVDDRESVRDVRAYLVRVTTRLALDHLRRRKTRREDYYGEWLPEPILTGPDLAEQMEFAERVSTALLLVLETLSPLERAVFVLHEAFGFSYAEIGNMLDRKETTVRQLARRARLHVDERRPRFEPDTATKSRVTRRFFAATLDGDVEGLLAVLAPEVVLIADSGGKARAPLLPVRGAEKVARFLVSAGTRVPSETRAALAELNGMPGVVASAQGHPIGAATLAIERGLITNIYIVVNPDKLQGLRPVDG